MPIRSAPTAVATIATPVGYKDANQLITPSLTSASPTSDLGSSAIQQTSSVSNKTGSVAPASTEAQTGGATATTPAQPTNTPATADIIAGMVDGSFFSPNILNSYINTSYVWKLFSVGDTDILYNNTAIKTISDFFTTLDGLEQIVIAQTAQTTYDITDVVIESQVGGDFVSRGNNVTGFTVTIREPNGISFLDSLSLAASQQGIKNWQRVRYYLELNFMGYLADATADGEQVEGSIVNGIDAGVENGGRWLWDVTITNVDVDLKAGGGSYVLQMLPHSQTLLTDDYATTPEFIIAHGGTAKEMLDSFADGLNQAWQARLADPDNKVVKYDFSLHTLTGRTISDLGSVKLTPQDIGYNYERSLSMDSENGVPTLHVPRGTTISDVIQTIFANSEDAQKIAKDSAANNNSPDDSETQVNAKNFRETMIIRGKPQALIMGFDNLTKTYCRHITWNVYGWETQRPVVSQLQKDKADDPGIQQEMIAAMARKGFIRKKYDYLFTGMNTEVLDFDLHFNMAWSMEFPRMEFYNNEQATTHALINSVAQPSATNLMDQLRQAIDKRSDAAQNLSIVMNDKTATQADKNTAQSQFDDAAQEVRILTGSANSYRQLPEASISALTPKTAKTTSPIYAEDTATSTSPFVFSVRVSDVDEERNQTGAGMVGQYHAGKTIYGAILNQVYGMETSQFQNIDLKIVGDPYWLGAGSFEQVIADLKDTPVDTNLPDYDRGGSNFLINIKYPIMQDENAAPTFSPSAVVSGVYEVTNVTHNFNNGKFTQSVKALRQTLFDPAKALSSTNQADPSDTYTSTVASAIVSTQLPVSKSTATTGKTPSKS